MQQSDIPSKSAKVFAQSATGTYVRAIPQTAADPGQASFDIGFPPQTFTDEGAGGTPPDGRDVNGILNFLSSWARWFMAAGQVTYDSTFQTAIGGYPKGAVVTSATTEGVTYRSTTENNVTNPDTGGAGWTKQFNRGLTSGVQWNTWPSGSGTTMIRMSGTTTFNSETSTVVSFPFALATVTGYGATAVQPGAFSLLADQSIHICQGGPSTTTITLACNEMGPNHVYPFSGRWFVEGILA